MCRVETFYKVVILTESFVIREKLPSLNDTIAKNRANRYVGAKYKAEIESTICYYIKDAVAKGLIHKRDKPCYIAIEWSERTKRRDADNIQSSQKFILDSLVKCGILKDDSRKYVKNVVHTIVDGKTDSVKVTIADSAEIIIS